MEMESVKGYGVGVKSSHGDRAAAVALSGGSMVQGVEEWRVWEVSNRDVYGVFCESGGPFCFSGYDSNFTRAEY